MKTRQRGEYSFALSTSD